MLLVAIIRLMRNEILRHCQVIPAENFIRVFNSIVFHIEIICVEIRFLAATPYLSSRALINIAAGRQRNK